MKLSTPEIQWIPHREYSSPGDRERIFFSFTGLANFPASPSPAYLGIQLYLNGGEIADGRTEEAHNVADLKSQLTLQLTLNLKKRR